MQFVKYEMYPITLNIVFSVISQAIMFISCLFKMIDLANEH